MVRAKIGKIDQDTFTSFLLQRLGKKDETVLVPPQMGVDAAVIDMGEGKVLIIAEDPILAIPGQPWEMFGWYTVHIGASDVAVMGVKPRYMTYSLLMPPETRDEDFKTIVDAIHEAALDLDLAIVGGHTGYYPGFAAPTIGGVTVFAVADKDSYVTPAGAKPGNDVILTKGPAIETAGILAVLREKELLKNYPASLVEKAKALCRQMTVVKDCLIAMETGGVTAMHDATEGGLLNGVYEIAAASGTGVTIHEDKIVIPDEIAAVCRSFNIDPLISISEGTLVITAAPENSAKIIKELKTKNINAWDIGEITKGERLFIKRGGDKAVLEPVLVDPFWPAYFSAVEG